MRSSRSKAFLFPIAALLVVSLSVRVSAQTDDAPAPSSLLDTLFASDQLHDLWIHINAADWAALTADAERNAYYPADIEWEGLRVNSVGIRMRGTGSRNPIKPGLQIDFNRYVGGQEFLGLKTLVLDNLWQDPSMVKERVTMRFFERMGVPAPREAHIRLFVGSHREFAGVYAVVENIDEAFLRRNFAQDEGYLYEYKWVDEYHFEDLGPDLDPYALRFEPRTHRRESTFALYAPIQDLVRAINDASPFDLEARVSPHLDLDAFVTHVALENFLSEIDGILGGWGMANFYLYRFAGRTDSRVIVWDKDNTFTTLEMAPTNNVDANVLMAKVWAVPRLRALYLQVLLDAAASADRWLADEVARQSALIHDAALADPLKPTTNEAYEQAAADVTLFAQERSRRVRELVAPYVGEVSGTNRIRSLRLRTPE